MKYACAEGGAHLPIVHTIHLPEPTKKTNLRAAKGPEKRRDTGKYVEGKERKNNAKFSGHYVRTTLAPIVQLGLCLSTRGQDKAEGLSWCIHPPPTQVDGGCIKMNF